VTWVKICGMTNLEDALVAVDAGADAVGFVFYEKSPRNVSVETAREIVEKLPADIEKVGVFVNESAERINSIVQAAGLTAVQIYAGESKPPDSGEWSPILDYKVIVALSSDQLRDDFVMTGALPGTVAYAVLIDSGSGARPGGTGLTFEWGKQKQLVEFLMKTGKVIVAGGLTSANVNEAMNVLEPWGVDVVSGVEARPGKKDPQKVRAFVKAVREMDRRVG
jgi:phosphoribosylanthranilate isomerase